MQSCCFSNDVLYPSSYGVEWAEIVLGDRPDRVQRTSMLVRRNAPRTYRRGQYFELTLDGEHCICRLVQPCTGVLILIEGISGNRWADQVQVASVNAVTEDEMTCLAGRAKYELID